MINIDNSRIIDFLKNQLNHLVNILIRKFRILRNILLNFLFTFTNLSQRNFLRCQKFFILTKNLNTASTHTKMKQNLLP